MLARCIVAVSLLLLQPAVCSSTGSMYPKDSYYEEMQPEDVDPRYKDVLPDNNQFNEEFHEQEENELVPEDFFDLLPSDNEQEEE